MTSRNNWTKQQKLDYAVWAEHYQSYEKWLSKNPKKHSLYNMAVRAIEPSEDVDYYNGFIDAITHVLAIVQNTKDEKMIDDYACALLQAIAEKQTGERNICRDEKVVDDLGTIALEAIPSDKSATFYRGFRAGAEKHFKLAAGLRDQAAHLNPMSILSSVLYIQSGFCIGLMLQNWPREKRPHM